ncbi:hypothetical protein V8E54_000091 [Elaphomyces granulatus]
MSSRLLPANAPQRCQPAFDDRRTLLYDATSPMARVETDAVATAAARQEQAEIQRRHRLEHRYGDGLSQTPGFSSLVAAYQQIDNVLSGLC